MRRDLAEMLVGARLRQRAHQGVRRRHGEQLPQQAGLAGEPLGRCPHAAALGIAQQRREIGRAGKADPYRVFDAELAQPADPLQDRLGIEAELGDDVDRQAGGLRGLDLVGERAIEVLLRYARMAIGIGGDGDPRDAVTLQRAARCGTGSKPAVRSRAAVSIVSRAGLRGTAVT